jgi:hypothetical protein
LAFEPFFIPPDAVNDAPAIFVPDPHRDLLSKPPGLQRPHGSAQAERHLLFGDLVLIANGDLHWFGHG